MAFTFGGDGVPYTCALNSDPRRARHNRKIQTISPPTFYLSHFVCSCVCSAAAQWMLRPAPPGTKASKTGPRETKRYHWRPPAATKLRPIQTKLAKSLATGGKQFPRSDREGESICSRSTKREVLFLPAKRSSLSIDSPSTRRPLLVPAALPVRSVRV